MRSGEDPGGGSNPNPRIVYTYNNTDAGPYRVLVELTDNQDGNLAINKLSLGKILNKKTEYKQNVINVRPLGRKKLMVLTKTAQTANQLQEDQALKQQNYTAYIPKHFLTVSGVISGVPLEMTPEEIMANVSSTVPILGVTRLHRYDNGVKIPATRIGVTFRSNQIPKEVRMFCCTNTVQPFVTKAVFCQKCLRYNHRTQNCRSRQRCDKCTLSHEEEGYQQCQRTVKCLHCKTEGNHPTGDFNCPERKRQNNLKIILSKTNLTMMEAREAYPIYTENQYALLENIEEYPTLPETYANVSSSVNTNWTKPKQSNKGKVYQTSKRTSDDVNIGEMVPVYNDSKKRKNQQEENGTALFNRYRVNELEKLQWKLNQMQQRDGQVQQGMDQPEMEPSADCTQVSQSVVTTRIRKDYDKSMKVINS